MNTDTHSSPSGRPSRTRAGNRSHRASVPLWPFSCLVLAASLFLSALAGAQAPEVLKVEPPNWWIGHSINPVRVLVHGRNLLSARVEPAGPGLRVTNVKTNAGGTYLFADVTIAKQAKPGRHALKITTASGTATAAFDVQPPLPRAGRFQGFSPDDVIYLIMPDRFADGDPSNDDPAVSRGLFDRAKARYYHGGDFQGIIDRLPYLKDLGITAIWLNPVYDNNDKLNEREKYDGQAITDYHGYGAVDFYGVEEHFGDLAKFRELVDSAHKIGIKVIQDQVANHTGPYHPWVAGSPTPTWFNGTEANHLANTWQTWTLASPHADAETRKATLDGWFINILPDLNQDDPETARYLIQNTLWWLGATGLDAIRQDTLPYVPRAFWRDWMAAIKREYPKVNVVGEMFDGDPGLVSFFQGGRKQFDGVDDGIDSVFDFPLFFPVRRAFAQGRPIREVAAMFGHDYLYPNPSMLVTFAGLHDVARFMNEQGATAAGLKLAFTLLLTARGIPMIYYGDEIAMPGAGDPDNRRDFPGGWKDDPRNAFESSGRTPEQQDVFEHVRKLNHLRSEIPALRRGTMTDLLVTEQQYAFARGTESNAAVVVLNNDAQPATVMVPVSAVKLREASVWQDRVSNSGDVQVKKGEIAVRLPGRSAAVFVPKR